ncbi:MAG: redox-sensing transcriptional repressor Rex [Firmicutes bacterium]|nr:redox-sensing transcriptional repressor Rex [Bacillota bacterium]
MAGLISIPKPTLERLPVYYRVLLHCQEIGLKYISSGDLGLRSGFDHAQVRKDLNHIWSGGRPGLGYEVDKLADCLADFLGLRNNTDAVLVGAGRLGTALVGYPGFNSYGFTIVAVFDADENKAGKTLYGRPIMPMSRCRDLIERLGIKIGIITVPAASAQGVCDIMVEAGVQAIWNFAPVRLEAPDAVLVRSEDLAVGLTTLSYYIKKQATSADDETLVADGGHAAPKSGA